MVTNNDFPIKIEANDRRYIVCRCKAVYRDDVEYFTSLSNEIQAIGIKESFHSQKRKRTQLEHHIHNLMIQSYKIIKRLKKRHREEDQNINEDTNEDINDDIIEQINADRMAFFIEPILLDALDALGAVKSHSLSTSIIRINYDEYQRERIKSSSSRIYWSCQGIFKFIRADVENAHISICWAGTTNGRWLQHYRTRLWETSAALQPPNRPLEQSVNAENIKRLSSGMLTLKRIGIIYGIDV
ncbi:MAG: hypothetical protein EZS28_018199 [Streblomastix strix]|uniref:Uncharacterized protein n=1 Tax=Streblomastix strix TaxID=222440 RepID=A0A5J4VUW7_9EUKA|nr:MAG: hypothetical protein EZS28_018199 [Streblomastix strix]